MTRRRALTGSEDVSASAVVREVGDGVVCIWSGDSDGTRIASGKEEFGILGEVSSLSDYQDLVHRFLVWVTANLRLR